MAGVNIDTHYVDVTFYTFEKEEIRFTVKNALFILENVHIYVYTHAYIYIYVYMMEEIKIKLSFIIRWHKYFSVYCVVFVFIMLHEIVTFKKTHVHVFAATTCCCVWNGETENCIKSYISSPQKEKQKREKKIIRRGSRTYTRQKCKPVMFRTESRERHFQFFTMQTRLIQ